MKNNGGDVTTCKAVPGLIMAGTFFVSLAMLSLEVAMSRVLSVLLSYHYVFIVISMALLGLGTGAIVINVFRRRLAHNILSSLTLYATLLAISVPLSMLMILCGFR